MVSVIIVNWNGEKLLQDCFTSLKNQFFKKFEIIFVDNFSSDNSLHIAKQIASVLGIEVTFVTLNKNTGFAQGNNEGLKHCTGKYIALLNTDTIAEKDWLKNLVEAMDAHPEVGICASKLIVDEENVIDSAGDGFSTFGHAFKRGEGAHPQEYSEREHVFGACAGAALYRAEMIKQIGFFDEDFFIIFEDADLNFRAQLSGWRCLYVPDAVVYHKVGTSLKKMPAMMSYYAIRNDKLLKIKNLPLSIIFRNILNLVLGEVISFAYHTIRGGFKLYIKANFMILKNLPYYLRKRREIMNLRRVPDKYMQSLFTSGFRLYGFKRVKRYLAL